MTHPQRGAALITALLLLVVLTILGVSVMQLSRVQEKMAGNTRDVNVGFETAEGALRNAEGYLGGLTDKPIPGNAATDVVRQLNSIPDVANQDKPWWDANGQPFKDGSGKAMSGVTDNPRYVIEEINPGIPLGSDDTSGKRTFYLVTARSTGASGLSNVIVQSTYARKY